jgi:hypothetical protein
MAVQADASPTARSIAPLPATSTRIGYARALPRPPEHEAVPRSIWNPYEPVTVPSPGNGPSTVREAQSVAIPTGLQPSCETSANDVFMLRVPVATVDPATGDATAPAPPRAIKDAISEMANAELGALNRRFTTKRLLDFAERRDQGVSPSRPNPLPVRSEDNYEAFETRRQWVQTRVPLIGSARRPAPERTASRGRHARLGERPLS